MVAKDFNRVILVADIDWILPFVFRGDELSNRPQLGLHNTPANSCLGTGGKVLNIGSAFDIILYPASISRIRTPIDMNEKIVFVIAYGVYQPLKLLEVVIYHD
jgi:hypothetical protein